MTPSSSVLSPPPPSTAAAGIFHRDPFPSFFVPLTSASPSRFPTRLFSFQPRAAVGADSPVKKPISEQSFYELLGIGQTGTLPEIKQAYKQLARKYHPDVSPPGRVEEYTERFVRVQEAYGTLSDPRRREMYDRVLRSQTRMEQQLDLLFMRLGGDPSTCQTEASRPFPSRPFPDDDSGWNSTFLMYE